MSIFDLSEGSANSLYSISNVVVLIATLAGVGGAIGLFWAGGIKEKYAAIKELDTQDRITDSQKIAAVANRVAEEAKERTAIVEREALDLKVRLELMKNKLAPRAISKEQREDFFRITAKIPTGDLSIVYVSDQETPAYAEQIREMLEATGYGVPPSLSGVDMIFNSVPPTVGIGIEVGDESDKVAAALQEAFRLIGIPVWADVMPGRPGRTLIIGAKEER